MNDIVEFWLEEGPVVRVRSALQPETNDLISIKQKTYVVTSRNFAVDDSDDPSMCRMRLAVNIAPVKYT